MKRLALVAMALLVGCGTSPQHRPPPPSEPTPVLCAVPAGLTAPQPEPDRPRGTYSQRDVALYLIDLHAWGKAGWTRVEAIDQDNRDCRQRQPLGDAVEVNGNAMRGHWEIITP